MFSIGQAPSENLLGRWDAVVRAEKFLLEQLEAVKQPEKVFSSYNNYLAGQGYAESAGFFAYGQGYDYFESPLMQKGETLEIGSNMSLGLNIELAGENTTTYGADSFVTGSSGIKRLSQTPFTVFRT